MASFTEAGRATQFLNFAPFYTLQPVSATREKQLQLARNHVLQHLAHARHPPPD